MEKEEIKNIIDWYLECTEVLYKVERLYMNFLPIHYNTDEYFELKMIQDCSWKQLKKLSKDLERENEI